jgi:hypothetical protein
MQQILVINYNNLRLLIFRKFFFIKRETFLLWHDYSFICLETDIEPDHNPHYCP